MLVMLPSIKSELLYDSQWIYCFKTAAESACEEVIVVLRKKRAQRYVYSMRLGWIWAKP